jgi:uncharacterized protein
MTERDRQNIAVVRRFYQAERECAAPDIVWHVPGHNPVAGNYVGLNEYFELMPSRMAPLSAWDVQIRDVMVNGDYVVATIQLRGECRGKTVDLDGAHIFRIDGQCRIAEGWGFTNRQDALDEFFSG